MCNNNAARQLSRCYLGSHLVKNTTGAQNKPSKKNKSQFNTKGLQHFHDF